MSNYSQLFGAVSSLAVSAASFEPIQNILGTKPSGGNP